MGVRATCVTFTERYVHRRRVCRSCGRGREGNWCECVVYLSRSSLTKVDLGPLHSGAHTTRTHTAATIITSPSALIRGLSLSSISHSLLRSLPVVCIISPPPARTLLSILRAAAPCRRARRVRKRPQHRQAVLKPPRHPTRRRQPLGANLCSHHSAWLAATASASAAASPDLLATSIAYAAAMLLR